MAAVTGLTIVKRFSYRGDNQEEFSNTYHFKSPPPGDDASWMVVLNDVVACEQKINGIGVSFVHAYGYNSDDPNAHHVFQHDFTVPGPPPQGQFTGTGQLMAGDQAGMVEWKTDQLSSKGKPIFLRKFHHHGLTDPSAPDNIAASWVTVLTAYAANGPYGIQAVHGGLRGRARDCNVIAALISPYVTTRTLKRRGKRPVPKG